MCREEFELKLKEAGFNFGTDLTKKIGVVRASVTEWHKIGYPEYIICVLDYAIKVRSIELIQKKHDNNAFLKEEIGLYKRENLKLKEQIKELKIEANAENDEKFKVIQEDYSEELTKEKLDILLAKSRIGISVRLANFLDFHIQTVFSWYRTQKYPKYLKQLLEWLVYIKEFENKQQLKSSANNSILLSNMAKEKYQTLQTNNAKLKQKLEDCILMERMLKEKLKSR